MMNQTKTPKTTATTNKFWNFAQQDENAAELSVYGDIAGYQSWWDDSVTPKQFTDELTALGDVGNITVRINSGGGDVFAAVAIFTRLKSHKAKVTVIVDGWAASAATIIAMAGDVIKIPASASFMIHDPALGLLGYYTGEDLEMFVKELNVCKECIINAYMTKASKTRDEISELMSATSWFTGEQAVEEGFCDEVLFGGDSGKPIITDNTRYENMPKALIGSSCPQGGVPPWGQLLPVDITKPQTEVKEKIEMEIKNVQELRAAYPQLVKEVEDAATTAAATAERTRIKDIEENTIEGFEDLANAAKFEKPQSASDFSINVIKAFKMQGKDFLNNRDKDIEDSGVAAVGSVPTDGFNNKKDIVDEAIERRINAKNGGKS